MGTTPIYGIPYAEPSDAVAVYPATDKAAAERVEAILRAGTVPPVTDAFTALAGWAVVSSTLLAAGAQAFVRVTVTRTGAAIAPNAWGGITPTNLAVLDTGRFPIYTTVPLSPLSASLNRVYASMLAASTGNITIFATTPGRDISVNDQIQLGGWVFTA